MKIRLFLSFFRPSILGTIGSILGIAGGLDSLFGDSGGGQPTYSGASGSGPNFYQPTGLGGADQQWQTAMQNLWAISQGQANNAGAGVQQSYDQMRGINTQPYANAANQAGQQYGGLANMAGQYAGQLGAQGMDAINRGGALWQAGADPQRELYNRMQQQVTDQSRAGQSARGIAMGPYGAGIEQQALTNFDIDWRNNQLDRMLSAGQGANQAGQMAGADLSASMQFGQQMPQYTMQSGQVPFQAQQQIAQLPGQAAQQYSSAVQQTQLAPYQQFMNQLIPYMNYGTGAGANAYQGFAGQQGFNSQQQQLGGQAIGQGLTQFGNSPFGQSMNNAVNGWFGGGQQQFDPNYTSNAFSLDSGYGVGY